MLALDLKFRFSRVHWKYYTAGEKTSPRVALQCPVAVLCRTLPASRGVVFDVLGLWLLHGAGERCVFCKAYGSHPKHGLREDL